MIMRPTFYLVTIILFLTAFNVGAQQAEVVTKVISKKVPINASDEFSIIVEKADVRVMGWDRNFSEITITFSARHTDKRTASAELDYMQYSLSRDKNVIELRNGFSLPFNVDQIHSKLSVTIDVKFPVTGKLLLSNKYGTADLSGLSGNINASFSFCDVFLDDVTASVLLKSSYSEVRGNLRSTAFTCESDKSDLTLELKRGTYSFTANLGEIDLEIIDALTIDVKGARTAVTMRTDALKDYSYDLRTKSGKIYIDEPFKKFVRQDDREASLNVKADQSKKSIHIYTTYSPITIK